MQTTNYIHYLSSWQTRVCIPIEPIPPLLAAASKRALHDKRRRLQEHRNTAARSPPNDDRKLCCQSPMVKMVIGFVFKFHYHRLCRTKLDCLSALSASAHDKWWQWCRFIVAQYQSILKSSVTGREEMSWWLDVWFELFVVFCFDWNDQNRTRLSRWKGHLLTR